MLLCSYADDFFYGINEYFAGADYPLAALSTNYVNYWFDIIFCDYFDLIFGKQIDLYAACCTCDPPPLPLPFTSYVVRRVKPSLAKAFLTVKNFSSLITASISSRHFSLNVAFSRLYH